MDNWLPVGATPTLSTHILFHQFVMVLVSLGEPHAIEGLQRPS